MLHTGMDMHKKYSVVTVTDDDGNELLTGRRLNNDEQEIIEFLEEFDQEMKVVLEAGSNWYWMCDLLDEQGVENILCHPLKTKAIASARIKTDKLDSGILSHLCRMDFVPESYKPDIKNRHLRELLRHRAAMVKVQTSTKNRIHAILTKLNIENPFKDLFSKKGIRYLDSLELAPVYRESIDGYLNLLSTVREEIGRADGRVSGEIRGSEEARLIETIPGVGPVLSLTIHAEIGEIDRFHSARHLSSFAGLVPSVSQSGATTKHGHITRQGSAWLRWALVEAAVNTTKYPGYLRTYYLKLKKRKGKNIARVAVARKLSNYIYYMLKDGTDFNQVISYNKSKSDLG